MRAPVTPYPVLQRWCLSFGDEPAAVIVERLEAALRTAKSRANLYAGRSSRYAFAARYERQDAYRVSTIAQLLATERAALSS